ncbi:MAG TPA: thymidine phosphorylase [Gemmatimonadales bacterium]|nr:thymidine phosphorylase [Gemmatimonadales bacterium]
MVVARLIERKRDGGTLTGDEWRSLIAHYAAGEVPDYQMSALAMAVVFRGLAPAELDALTEAMLGSGERLRFAGETRPRIDKHSTGGVGDKTSLLLAPMLAACGVLVPMMSGRGLGHTGGTLDKLEAIRGFRTGLSLAEAEAQVRELGVAMLGQTGEIAPADRKLYALRDVTGTVESIPMISASIMSKKLAEGLTGLVLDVKIGSGAFLPEPERALELARTMIGLGEARGCPTVALLTAMDRPLGVACGNALEVRESIAGLQGRGPEDLMAVTEALGAEMLLLAGKAPTREAALAQLREVVTSGRALAVLRELVARQGGDVRMIDDPAQLPTAPVQMVVPAPQGGIVQQVEPRALGRVIIALGGGRQQVTDTIDPAVGLEVHARPGATVAAGDPLVTVHAATPEAAAAVHDAIVAAIPIGDATPEVMPLIAWRVTKDGAEPYTAER